MSNPFTHQHVINETLKHMSNSIAISTRKCLARLPESADNPAMRTEIFTALVSLNKLTEMLQSVRENNKDILE